MLNTSNRNVPTRRVHFFKFNAQITRVLKDDPSEVDVYNMEGSSEIHPLELEISERIALLGYADYSPWKVTDFKLKRVWEDSTDQYIY